jgi:hypothetical protein
VILVSKTKFVKSHFFPLYDNLDLHQFEEKSDDLEDENFATLTPCPTLSEIQGSTSDVNENQCKRRLKEKDEIPNLDEAFNAIIGLSQK